MKSYKLPSVFPKKVITEKLAATAPVGVIRVQAHTARKAEVSTSIQLNARSCIEVDLMGACFQLRGVRGHSLRTIAEHPEDLPRNEIVAFANNNGDGVGALFKRQHSIQWD